MKRTRSGALASLAIALPLPLTLTFAAPSFAAPPANSAYVTDAQHSYVEDATSRGIGQVNMITCIMSAMRPDALVNDGAYIAMVDMQKCDPNARRSEEHTSELQSQFHLVCRLLLEKKKTRRCKHSLGRTP